MGLQTIVDTDERIVDKFSGADIDGKRVPLAFQNREEAQQFANNLNNTTHRNYSPALVSMTTGWLYESCLKSRKKDFEKMGIVNPSLRYEIKRGVISAGKETATIAAACGLVAALEYISFFDKICEYLIK